ncbi:N-formylglutamate amidohydrolase [Candidatus Terasakiella magnetica]|nr:N-formylglutamate amidohydrolase [Candidatus Terasakiella magnetica]
MMRFSIAGMTRGRRPDKNAEQAMDTIPSSVLGDDHSVVQVQEPPRQLVPLVFASPHSGRDYPPEFVAASRLDPQTLRRSEDSFIDELYAGVTQVGAPLLAALFPRAYCDPNREPYELDPSMFAGPLPNYVNTRSPRVLAGLGTIARLVSSGADIYAAKLPVAEAERRIAHYYRPYHRRLQDLVEATKTAFGWSLLVDCHSMPSVGGPMDRDSGMSRVDVVLGDCFAAACAPIFTQAAEEAFAHRGYRVVRNAPYAGGFTTRHYGRPQHGSHALQIEINRGLYMEETTHIRSSGFAQLQTDINYVVGELATAAREFGGL